MVMRRGLTRTTAVRRCFLIAHYQLLASFFLLSPLSAQAFETLLKELSGPDADQLDAEMAEKRTKNTPLPSSTEMITAAEQDEFAVEKNIETSGVTLQGLDKTTARVFIIDAAVGQTVEFGTLKIVVAHCEKAPLENRQESMAFVTITEEKPTGEKSTEKPSFAPKVFSGWMFSSSPALSALDHPMYDIWIKECKDVKK
jgi:hypothetical protein